MSAPGGPGGRQVIAKPVPPERGSFPLDHDGECKPIMALYLRCLRSHRGMNDDECRLLSKQYLKCRMDQYVHLQTTLLEGSASLASSLVESAADSHNPDSNLMAQDEFKNLGYTDENVPEYPSRSGSAGHGSQQPVRR